MSDGLVLVHGLVIDSSIPLPGAGAAPAAAAASVDLTLRLGEPVTVGGDLPPGRLVALLERGGRLWHAVVRDDDGWLVRFGGAADVRLSADLSTATAHVDPDFSLDLFEVLANGFLLATVLQLRGDLVLHASAVHTTDGALALVGHSGVGKSTVATLLARAGAPLIGDDVVRVDDPGGTPLVRRGSAEARLRLAARGLGAGLEGVRETADDRLAVTPPVATGDRILLRAVLFPAPDREHDEVEVRRVAPADALVQLLASPRVLGWLDRGDLARQLGQCADLAGRVPALRVQVPWGPPFAQDLGARVLAAVRGRLTERAGSSSA